MLPSAKAVTELKPQFDEILKCPGKGGILVSGAAPSESAFDFYSRYFCPKFGINEVNMLAFGIGSCNVFLAPNAY